MPVEAATTLQLWEQALPLDDASRAVLLAAAVAPSVSPDEVMEWPLGRRDARLLRLRTALVGRVIDAVTACPSCGAEVSFDVDAVALERAGEVKEPGLVRVDGWQVACRPLTTANLVVAASAEDVTTAEELLLQAALRSVSPPDDASSEPLPGSVRRAVVDALAEADPLAEILVELVCPGCEVPMTATLDVSAFAWAAVDARARLLLRDVDELARAYGWSEHAVLALSDQRRAAYCAMVGGEGR